MNVDIQKRTSPKISRTSVFLVILGSVFFWRAALYLPIRSGKRCCKRFGLLLKYFNSLSVSLYGSQCVCHPIRRRQLLRPPAGPFLPPDFPSARQLGCRYFYEYDWRLPRRRQMRFRPAGPRGDLASASAPYALFLHQRRTGLRHYCRRCRLSA